MFNFIILIFIITNLLDLTLTLFLIRLCDKDIECNPFALFAYSEYGELGMAVYKILTTSIVVIISLFVYRTSQSRAYFILFFGSLVYFLVSLYTLLLIYIAMVPYD